MIRSDESYDYLAESSDERDLDERIKYIRLLDEAYLSLGGELRERLDRENAPRFRIGVSQDSFVLQRLLLHADLHLNDRVRAFVQLGRGDAFSKQQPYGPSDADHTDLQNGFVDWIADDAKHLTLRLGRQELQLNTAQRFVSVREGPNIRQSFDGLRVMWDLPSVHVNAFATRPVSYRIGSFDDSSDPAQKFYGVDATRAVGTHKTVQGYVLGFDRVGAKYRNDIGDERRRSLGVRWAMTSGAIDHDFEAVVQTGTFAQQRIRAWALGLIAGYTVQRANAVRVGLEFDSGSGDRHRGDGKLETFNPMFPKGAYFNESSLTSWANLLLVKASVSVRPSPSLDVSASVSERWRQTGNDAVYLQPMVPLAGTLGNNTRRVGEGLQLDGTWRYGRHLTFSAELLHQSAGPALRQAGGHAVDFAMLIGQFRF